MKKNSHKKKHIIIYTIISILYICFFTFIGFCIYIYIKSPEFNSELLYKQESTNIYDSENNLIATLGTEKRQLVTYNDLPEVLIDAIIATEDSRYFEHNGFDLPRFVSSMIHNVKLHKKLEQLLVLM